MQNLQEEEQLVVEREIMMSIFGMFVDSSGFNLNDISIESETNNNQFQAQITESQLDEDDHNINKSSVRRVEKDIVDKEFLSPATMRSAAKSDFG